jgi:hypothetical protein
MVLLALERAVDSADGRSVSARDVVQQLVGSSLIDPTTDLVHRRLKVLDGNGLVIMSFDRRQRSYNVSPEGDVLLGVLAEADELPVLPPSPHQRRWLHLRSMAAKIVDDCQQAADFLSQWAQSAAGNGDFVELYELADALKVAYLELALCRFVLEGLPEPEPGCPIQWGNLHSLLYSYLPDRYQYIGGYLDDTSIGWH